MGLFSKKEICSICNENEGKQKIAEGYVCKECLKLCGGFYPANKPFKLASKNDIQTAINNNRKNKDLVSMFSTTNKIGNYIEFDEGKRLWLVPDGFNGKKINPKVFSYDDIIDYELLEDGESVTKGGLGRAVVGGVLLGGVGAVVGGVTGKKKTKTLINSLKIKITVNNISIPSVYIGLLMTQTKSNSIIYKAAYSQAQQILSMLSIISSKREIERNEESVQPISVSDELIKLKALLDDGVLTKEEFETQKNKILSI